MNPSIRPLFILGIFISQALIDWTYVLCVKAQPIINNSWFVFIPIMSYFYITFALIACYYIYTRKSLGLNIAYCVLLFGMMADVMSYSLIMRQHELMEFLIIPLILCNLCVMAYMAYHQSDYNND